jgi:hypothetical protein
MPDSRFAIYEHHNATAQAAHARGVRQSEDDQARTEWLRADEAFDILKDVIGNLEGIRGLSDALEDAKGWLDNAKAQTRAVCKGEG